MSELDDAVLHAAIYAIRETLRLGRRPELPAGLAGDADFVSLLDELADLSSFALAIAQGSLDGSLRQRGSMAGALKTLQAGLRHLTWQTQQVAAGDFSQRVDFMGEFSTAFNTMVLALAEARGLLAHQNEELRSLAERLEQLATTDQLTDVANRRKFDEVVAAELKRAERYSQPLSLLILDLDKFKLVNDAHGHSVGDDVLVALTRLVAPMLRASDSLVRWGGEEFVVLAPGTNLTQAAALAERIRAGVAAQLFPKAGRITVSAGVAEYRHGDTADDLVARADAALYAAKAQGRNQVALSGGRRRRRPPLSAG